MKKHQLLLLMLLFTTNILTTKNSDVNKETVKKFNPAASVRPTDSENIKKLVYNMTIEGPNLTSSKNIKIPKHQKSNSISRTRTVAKTLLLMTAAAGAGFFGNQITRIFSVRPLKRLEQNPGQRSNATMMPMSVSEPGSNLNDKIPFSRTQNQSEMLTDRLESDFGYPGSPASESNEYSSPIIASVAEAIFASPALVYSIYNVKNVKDTCDNWINKKYSTEKALVSFAFSAGSFYGMVNERPLSKIIENCFFGLAKIPLAYFPRVGI